MGQTSGVESLPFLILLLIGALVFTMPLIGGLNIVIERLFYRPLRGAPRVAPLITAIGVSFILQNLALVIAERRPKCSRWVGRSRSAGHRSPSSRSSSSRSRSP
jgi:branched-subunit amino acid ABC-type transport system permease component